MPPLPDNAYLRAFVADPPRPVVFEEGLTPAEFEAVEQRFDFAFPPDLRAFLTNGLPISDGFPNWRADPHAVLRERLERPADGICFDIEHNAFWYEPWGPRPADLEDACALARRHLAATPTLVPIYAHRYIPVEPARVGNPVLSIVQADVICYGANLEDYLAREFGEDDRRRYPPQIGQAALESIPFWGDVVMGRHRGGL